MKNITKILNIIYGALFVGLIPLNAQFPNESDKIDLGFGVTQDKSKSTASVATISGDELRQGSAINLKEALYGKLLGVTALKNGGFEGDRGFGAFFNVRGLQSTSETNVLVLVDGFERPIDRMSVEEVESVSVYKDAAALSLYGYRGLNGIISVTTKRGSGTENRTGINVNYLHKTTFAPSITKMADSFTYAQALNEARTNDGLSKAYSDTEIDAFKNNLYPYVYPNVDWSDELLRGHGSENQVNLSLTGRYNKIQHYVLFNYVGNSGLLKNTNKNDGYSTQLISSKANIRLNVDYEMTNTTLFSVSTQASFIETNRPATINAGNIFQSIYYLPPSAFPVRLENGLWGGNTTYGTSNPVAAVEATGHSKTHARSVYGDMKLKQDLGAFVQGLSVSVRAGFDSYSEIRETKQRGFSYGNINYVFDENGNKVDETFDQAGDLTGNLQFNSGMDYHWRRANYIVSADYARDFGKNEVSASLIYNGEVGVFPGRYNEIDRSNFFFSGHYGYDNRYMLDVVYGLVGSNRSYPEKWDYSTSAALAWVISNESFLKNHSKLQLLKLRASGGILHSDYTPRPGLSFEDYSGGYGDYFFGNGYSQTWGFYMPYLPTASFNHERAKMLNIGLDLRAFNALTFTTEFFYNRRDNILQPGDGVNSMIFGLPPAYINKGIVDSKGVEIGLQWEKSTRQLTYRFGAQFSFARSEIKDCVETPQIYQYLSKIGSKPKAIYGLEVIGIYNTQEQLDTHIQEFDRVQLGDLMYKDQNGDGVINENDMVELKYTNGVPEINYSFNIGLEYKGLGFNATFQGAGNFYRPLNRVGVFRPIKDNANVSMYYLNNCWHPNADNSNATLPRLSSQGSINNEQTSDVWFANGAFFKLRHCEIYYNLPQKWMSKCFISSARIFVKGENLLSFDKFPEVDSEVYWSGAYPTLKSVSAGITVNF